jgi:hypothetical protein
MGYARVVFLGDYTVRQKDTDLGGAATSAVVVKWAEGDFGSGSESGVV